MVFPRREEQMIIPGIFCFFFSVHSEQKNIGLKPLEALLIFQIHIRNVPNIDYLLLFCWYVLKVWGKYDLKKNNNTFIHQQYVKSVKLKTRHLECYKSFAITG